MDTFIKKGNKYYRKNSDNTQTQVTPTKEGYFTWVQPDGKKVRSQKRYKINTPVQSKKEPSTWDKIKKGFVNLTMGAANADESAVTTASGWQRDKNGNWNQNAVNNPGVKQLRENIAILSGLAEGADVVPLAQGAWQVVRHPVQTGRGILKAGKQVYTYGKNVMKNVNSRFTPYGFRIGNYAYKPSRSTLSSGFPAIDATDLRLVGLDRETRPYYYDIDPNILKLHERGPYRKAVIQEGYRGYSPPGMKILREAQFETMEPQLQLQQLISDHNGYGVDVMAFPKTHLEYDARMMPREYHTYGPKNLPLVGERSRDSDVVYSLGHRIWNQLDSKVKQKLEPIFSKVWDYAPTKGSYSPGERAFAVVKDVQAQAYRRWLRDNNPLVGFKDFGEFEYYIDDIPEEVIRNYFKQAHGGHWENSVLLTDENMENIIEALKHKNGGRIQNRRNSE